MEYQATAKYVRSSTRKVRLIADSVRTLRPVVALAQLSNMPKEAATPLLKVMASAIANAKQKNAKEETLRTKIIEVMGAGGMKRWHAVSRGQAHGYKKRMTHIRVILTDEGEQKKEEMKVQE
jgi:large subunit ribosomal protein L22